MRLDEGKQRIVIEFPEDGSDLRAFCESHLRPTMALFDACPKTRSLWRIYLDWNQCKRSVADCGTLFLSMVALALADAPKDAAQGNVEPFKGILSNLSALPKRAPDDLDTDRVLTTSDMIAYNLSTRTYLIQGNVEVTAENLEWARKKAIRTSAVNQVMTKLMPILRAHWPDKGEYLLTCTPRGGKLVQKYSRSLEWAVRTCLWRKDSGGVFYSSDGSGVNILRKNDNLVRVMEGEFETAAFDLNQPGLGNLYRKVTA